MKNFKIGEKIRKRRKEKGMTQAALASDKITRSMLSLIESGAALPSLETAEYLAEALELPLAYLLSDTDDLFLFEKSEKIAYIKDLFLRKNYIHCIDIINSLSSTDDEVNYIHAYSAFGLGKQMTIRGSFISAVKYLTVALEYSKQTIYNTLDIEAAAPLYLAIANNIQSPLLELDQQDLNGFFSSSYDYELLKYISLDFEYDYEIQIFKKHMQAKALLKRYAYSEAITVLSELEEYKSSQDYNACVLFGVYSDLEYAYKQLGDFENAYRYSSKQISLLNAFKS